MERVIEKLKTENAQLKIVAEALIKQCEKEPAFIDKILNENKSLNDCWDYIKSRAKKEAKSGCAVIDHDTVFGWAIHYFDEEVLEDWKPANEKVKTSTGANDDDASYEETDTDDNDNENEKEESELEEKPKKVSKSEPKKQDNQKELPSIKQPEVVVKKPKGVVEGQISLF